MRHIDVWLWLWDTHGVPVSLVHAEMSPLGSHAHTEAVGPARPATTVDDVLGSPVVLAVHVVAAPVLSSGSEGRSRLGHDLTRASTWGTSASHPLLLVLLGSLGQDVVLDTNLSRAVLVGNGVNSLLRVLGHHAVRRVHVEGTLGGRPRHVLGRRRSPLLIWVLEPRLLARLLVGVTPWPSTGVLVRVGHGKV